MEKYALELNGVTKQYKDFKLDSISFTVPQGSIMYALLCLLGIVVGLALSIIITSIRNEIDTHLLLLFTCMTTTMIFMSGAILIPCYYFIKEELSGAIGILAYGISGVFFFGMIKLIENHVLALTISIFTAIILFVISWCFLCQQIINRDI